MWLSLILIIEMFDWCYEEIDWCWQMFGWRCHVFYCVPGEAAPWEIFFSRTTARSEGREKVIWRSDTKGRKEKGDLERPHPWEIFRKSRTIERKKDLHPIVLFFKQAFFEESYKLCMLSRYALYHLCFEILWICMLLWILFILDVILRCLDVCLIALIYVWLFDLPLLKKMLCVILPN